MTLSILEQAGLSFNWSQTPKTGFLMTWLNIIHWSTSIIVVFFLSVVSCYQFIWAASSEFRTYRLCEQRRFRRACASAQSRQNLRCSLMQAVSQEEPSDRKPDPWPLWTAAHAQLKFVMTECSKTQIRLTRHILFLSSSSLLQLKMYDSTIHEIVERQSVRIFHEQAL